MLLIIWSIYSVVMFMLHMSKDVMLYLFYKHAKVLQCLRHSLTFTVILSILTDICFQLVADESKKP